MPKPTKIPLTDLREQVLCLEERLAASDARVAELEARLAQLPLDILATVEARLAALPQLPARPVVRKLVAGEGGAPVVGRQQQAYECAEHGTVSLNTAGQCPKCFCQAAQRRCLGHVVQAAAH